MTLRELALDGQELGWWELTLVHAQSQAKALMSEAWPRDCIICVCMCFSPTAKPCHPQVENLKGTQVS